MGSCAVTFVAIWGTFGLLSALSHGGPAGLGPTVVFANDRYHHVDVVRSRDASNPICEWVRDQGAACRVLFTTPGGRQVAHGQYGSFFYEITFGDQYIALSAREAIDDTDLAILADALYERSPDEWLDRLEAFENSTDF